MKKNLSGFTLIELLIVIAIIGILASVILVSLQGSKNRATDARIKGELKNARLEAEIVGRETSSFETVCEDSEFQSLYLGALHAYDSGGSTITCNDGATEWAAYVPLKSSGGSTVWCVDSGENEKEITKITASATSCDGIAASAPPPPPPPPDDWLPPPPPPEGGSDEGENGGLDEGTGGFGGYY